MHRRPMNGDDIRLLNEQVASHDPQLADLARRTLSDALDHPECFADSTAEEWARRIVRRVNRALHA